MVAYDISHTWYLATTCYVSQLQWSSSDCGQLLHSLDWETQLHSVLLPRQVEEAMYVFLMPVTITYTEQAAVA